MTKMSGRVRLLFFLLAADVCLCGNGDKQEKAGGGGWVDAFAEPCLTLQEGNSLMGAAAAAAVAAVATSLGVAAAVVGDNLTVVVSAAAAAVAAAAVGTRTYVKVASGGQEKMFVVVVSSNVAKLGQKRKEREGKTCF